MHARILRSYDDQWEMNQMVQKRSIPHYNESMMGFRTYIAVYEGDLVVGIASITETTVWHDDAIGVGYISTHKHFRKRGVAKLLVQTMFEYAASTKRNISNTPYEPDGELYLRHVMQRTAEQFPEVILYERER